MPAAWLRARPCEQVRQLYAEGDRAGQGGGGGGQQAELGGGAGAVQARAGVLQHPPEVRQEPKVTGDDFKQGGLALASCVLLGWGGCCRAAAECCLEKRHCAATSAPSALHCPALAWPLQFKEYLDRAEYIKGILDGRQPAEEASGQNGAAAAKGPRPGGGGGGGGGDGKQVGRSPAAGGSCCH